MSILRELLSYEKICIQCHNNPDADAVASAFGLYRYFTAHGKKAFIVYGGETPIKKSNMKLLLKECEIPITHTHQPEEFDLLLMTDSQYGQTNAESFPAKTVAIIDHHIRIVPESPLYLVKSDYQSCSTVVYELLLEEGYPVMEDEALKVALLYGLYTDTSSFADLFGKPDIAMRTELFSDQPLFDRLVKSSMSVAELLIVSDAMLHHYLDIERKFVIVSALKCEQTVLGVIGDFMIRVDAVYLSFSYTDVDDGYQFSIRTCHEKLPANKIAAFVCDGIGGGGGHGKKAGGRILKERMKEKYGEMGVSQVVEMLLCRYIDEESGLIG